MTTPPPDAEAGLRLNRFADQVSAFGLAISYLMGKPAFQGLPFGHWAQTIAGQINRNHYVFACRGETVVGFAGWAFASVEEAEAWLTEDPGASAGGDAGPCLIINCWAVDSPEAHQLLRNQIRIIGRDSQTVYAKRRYENGRIRPLRLGVNAFIGAHIEAAQARRGGT